MIKKFLLYSLILILIVLFGCNGGNGQGHIDDEPVYKGQQGLSLEIIQESLPEKVYENEEFNLVLKLTNYGAYPISPGDSVLKISTEEEYMEFTNGENVFPDSFDLKGKETYNTLNDFEVKEYNLRAKSLDKESQQHPVKILATACYNYHTIAFADVCIDTDVYNVKEIEKVCQSQPISLSGGQGAPVEITRIEPAMLSDGNSIKPQFKIYIRNSDQGSVIKHNSYNTICSSDSPQRDHYNLIELAELKFSNYNINDFSCEPKIGGKFVAKLENEEDSIVCTLNNGIPKSKLTYQTPLNIEFKYGYVISKYVQLDIKKLPD
jgi:hypothetical protein